MRAKFYNPIIGRFTQEDVYRGDGLNLYAYCGNNPVGYYDPSGYEKRECPLSKENNKGKAIHKNSNDYVGHQGVYEIKIDGNLHKYGKADMTKIANTGNPKRLQTQVNKLQRQNPNSEVTGKVIYENKNISTANIKKVETKAVQSYYDKYKQYPPGNQSHPGINK